MTNPAMVGPVYALNLFNVADRDEYLAYSRRSAKEVRRRRPSRVTVTCIHTGRKAPATISGTSSTSWRTCGRSSSSRRPPQWPRLKTAARFKARK
jgi:hypothetical protein